MGNKFSFNLPRLPVKREFSWCRPQALGGLHYAGSASCTAVHRLLDPKNTSVALGTLNRAARSLGCKVKLNSSRLKITRDATKGPVHVCIINGLGSINSEPRSIANWRSPGSLFMVTTIATSRSSKPPIWSKNCAPKISRSKS